MKRTFKEWEQEMTLKIGDVQKATQTICGVIFSTPLRQTATCFAITFKDETEVD